jgi:hypothetical protein
MPRFTGPMTDPMAGQNNTRIAQGSVPASAIANQQSDQEDEASKKLTVFRSHIRAPDERILRSPSRQPASWPPSVCRAGWHGRSPDPFRRPLPESRTMRWVPRLSGVESNPGDDGPKPPGKTRLRRSSFSFEPLDKTGGLLRRTEWADRFERRLASRGRGESMRGTAGFIATLWRGLRS